MLLQLNRRRISNFWGRNFQAKLVGQSHVFTFAFVQIKIATLRIEK